MAFDLASLMSGQMGSGVPASPGFRMPGFGPRFGGAIPWGFSGKPQVQLGPQTQPGQPMVSPQLMRVPGIDRVSMPPPQASPMPQNLASLPARMPTPAGQPFVQRRY